MWVSTLRCCAANSSRPGCTSIAMIRLAPKAFATAITLYLELNSTVENGGRIQESHRTCSEYCDCRCWSEFSDGCDCIDCDC